MTLVQTIMRTMPELKEKLITAGVNKKPKIFIKESLAKSFAIALILSVLSVFLLLKMNQSALLAVPLFIVLFIMLFYINLKSVDAKISKRAKEIDREVLFAGRFLLVKLNSGKPLINSLFDASKSYGVASKYFKEIVESIELGTPIEDALENACRTTPSKKFRKILFQINTALKIGIDVSGPLEATLDEITEEQLIDIQRYGKKMSSITMFYMLLAVVLPSLGITLFSIVSSLMSVKIDMQTFWVLLFFLAIVEIMFVTIFKNIRPNLNI